MRIQSAPALLALALIGTQGSAQTPTFSSRVEAVRVDVLVRDRGGIVRGLQAADFEVVDSGIHQVVDLVILERLPLKVVMVLDMSDSVAGERLDQLRAACALLLDQLAPDDEAALVTFSHVVAIDSPLTTDRTPLRAALVRERAPGRTALIDATHAGIVLGEAGVGRTLLIVFSDGVDTSSWLSAEGVLDTARRSDVVAYFVSDGEKRTPTFNRELTALTGGAFIEIASTKDLGATFVRILEEFRQRYVISYTPRGVPAGGWHRLEVRVKRRGTSVHARPGYHARN
jgi:Ca-activated chloride channel homolog